MTAAAAKVGTARPGTYRSMNLMIGSGLTFGLLAFLPTALAQMVSPSWETLGTGGIAAFLVGYLVKQNTDLSKQSSELSKTVIEQARMGAQSEVAHKQELVKLIADQSISQTVLAEAMKDVALSNNAIADSNAAQAKAMEAIAKAFDRDSTRINRLEKADRA